MSRVSVTFGNTSGEVSPIPSKSAAHRLLICASLASGESRIECPADSADIEATARCLNSLGADIRYDGKIYTVNPIKKRKSAVLDCGESGSTLRFLIPVASALGGDVTLRGEGRLSQRPISPLLRALEKRGASFTYDGALPVISHGGLSGGEFEIAGNVSSQFISGMLFALPLLSEKSTIKITGGLQSAGYVKMTLDALEKFGVSAYVSGENIEVFPSEYRAREISVEGDWSNGAFFLALGAIASEKGITCTGLRNESVQGDKEIIPILRRFGADISESDGKITVKKRPLRGIDIDAGEIPDLVPVLSVVACAAEGKTHIYNASRLRLKESDRIESTSAMIRALGGRVETGDDFITVFGTRLRGGTALGANDHRIVMSSAVAAAVCSDRVIIDGAEAVKKSYGNFFEELALLGAKTERM